MKVDSLKLNNTAKAIEGMTDLVQDVKSLLEHKINLSEYSGEIRPIVPNTSTVLRFCLLVGLCDKSPRRVDDFANYPLAVSNTPYATTFFTKNNIGSLFEALIKLRYHDIEGNWNQGAFISKVLGREILRGRDLLLQDGTMDEWLHFSPLRGGKSVADIPQLNLCIGHYENGTEAMLDLNSRKITNTQILIAGATGSGKSNLLAVLINQIRSASSDTHFPVNFLLFDYKGEFSDPANRSWLNLFDTDESAILNPMEKPLPFTPFPDFTDKVINELNLYSTAMSSALSALSQTSISANMEDRLSNAICNAYKHNQLKPITFELLLDEYNALLPEKKRGDTDSVKSVLSQLVKNNIFATEDKIDLIHTCNIINLGRFQKDGVMAKAIVYFVISKLNAIYDRLPKQETNEDYVEIRHFTIIDEAHYMLGFENKPLQNLIAVGRNKGMSVILATQNMEQFKSKHFDFYANAQYPLIMRQQQQNDQVLKDLFGLSGTPFQELKQAIAGLAKGELIIKDNRAIELGMGRRWKKICVNHLI